MTKHGRFLERAGWFASHVDLSYDQRHRYTLTRVLDPHNDRMVQFIGLNPSTADQYHDDPTVRRCIGFARAWGFGTFVMTNIHGLRSTDPKELYREHIVCTHGLRKYSAVTGVLNDQHLVDVARRADLIVCAWGTHGAFLGRGAEVTRLLRRTLPEKQLHCLGRTREGHPKHPLYLSKSTALEPFGQEMKGPAID